MTDSPTFASFNPSKDPLVDEIKAKTDELIALVQSISLDGNPGRNRRVSLAVTNYEQAAMWAVKAWFS